MPGLATPTIICSHHRFSPGGQPPTSPSLTLVVNRTIARDPTRTLTIRNAFASDAGRRFRELRGAIRTAVVEEDVFALRQDAGGFVVGQLQTPGPKAFNFAYSYQKLEAFDIWLNRQIDVGLLSMSEFPQLGQGMQQAWTDKYIHASYQQGIQRARTELIGAGFDVPTIAASGGIQVAFNNPFHLDRVGGLYTRTFSELKGITAAMDQQISRVLAQAMAEGRGPAHIARLLTRTISGPVGDLSLTDTLGRFIPAERRAKIMARTEVIRAHHVATIQEYRNWGAAGVIVKAEWSTAQDGRVCEQCLQLEGLTFTLDQIQGRIPLHAQCRCMAIPFEVEAPPIVEERELLSRADVNELEKDAIAEVSRVGKETSKEGLVAISRTGEIRRTTGVLTGEVAEVEFDAATRRLIATWDDVTIVHNHPLEQTFSMGDITQFGDLPGFKKGTVVLPSGEVHTITRPAGVLFDRAKASALSSRYTEVIVDDFLDDITAGRITKAAAKEKALIKVLEEAKLKFKKDITGKAVAEEVWNPITAENQIHDGLKNFGFQSVEAVKASQGIKKVNVFGEELTGVFNRRPGVADFVRSRVDKSTINLKARLFLQDASFVSDEGADMAAGYYDKIFNEITLPGSGGKKSSLSIGRPHVVGQGAVDTLRHEYGHHLHMKMMTGEERKRWFREIWDKDGRRGNYFKGNVSKYSGTNINESFAESFAAWTHPEYGTTAAKTLPSDIEEFMENIFK